MGEYEYWGLMARSWDLLRGDTSRWADRFFYFDLIQQFGQPVLDVGCGTGRLLLDYLSQGVEVHGVDNSPDMLSICREKAQKQGLAALLYLQEMENLCLPRRYRTILVPSSSLQLVIEPERASQAVRRLFVHLLPGGALAASFMTLWKEGQPLESEHVSSAVRQEDGATIRRVSKSWYDPALECERTEDLYQVIRQETILEEEIYQRDPATRSYTQAQAVELFQKAGFEQVQVFHEFTHTPVLPEDTLFTLVGVRSK